MADNSIADSRILIVDDNIANTLLLEGILEEEDYNNFMSIIDSRQVLSSFLEFKPDIVLLDLHMPHMDGFDVMTQLREIIPPESYLPILVLTADITSEVKRRALSDGATDFLTKPFDPIEVELRIRNLLQTRSLHQRLQNQNQNLDQKVRERTFLLEESRIEVLNRLAIAAEYRDDNTGEHTQRVGRGVAQIAAGLGLSDKEVSQIRLASPLHDIGKIGIPDSILLKPGKLTPEEWEVMKTHATIGANILSGSQSPLLQMAEEIALTHHERWDGTGYFDMKSEEIPLSGRIVTIVDVYDALTHGRPYKMAWSVDKALDEIKKQIGKQFDPQVVEVFLETIGKEEYDQ
jgi:putative two-component system response regulator